VVGDLQQVEDVSLADLLEDQAHLKDRVKEPSAEPSEHQRHQDSQEGDHQHGFDPVGWPEGNKERDLEEDRADV
jgi:hypothetical protein